VPDAPGTCRAWQNHGRASAMADLQSTRAGRSRWHKEVNDGQGMSAEVCASSQASSQHFARHQLGGVLKQGEGTERRVDGDDEVI